MYRDIEIPCGVAAKVAAAVASSCPTLAALRGNAQNKPLRNAVGNVGSMPASGPGFLSERLRGARPQAPHGWRQPKMPPPQRYTTASQLRAEQRSPGCLGGRPLAARANVASGTSEALGLAFEGEDRSDHRGWTNGMSDWMTWAAAREFFLEQASLFSTTAVRRPSRHVERLIDDDPCGQQQWH